MFMKKTFLYTFLFTILILTKSVAAQSGYQIYVSDIDTAEMEYSVGQQIDGKFTLSNLSSIAQSDMYYTISSGLYSEESMSVNNVLNISKEVGPLYVKGLSKDVVNFSYNLPKSLVGNSAIKITVKLKDGTILAEGIHSFGITGESSVESLNITEGYLKISGFDQKIGPLVGPTVYSGEKIDLYLTIPKTEKEYNIKTVLKLYDRSEKEEFLLKTVDLKNIKTETKESISVISLPVDLNPLVYFGVISFEADGLEVSSVNVRYIVAGSIATIRNMTTETLEVKKGEIFNVNVVYGGQPIDEMRPEKQIKTSSTTITVVATNEKGDIVSEATQPVVISEDGNGLVIPMTANISAKGLTLKGYIKSEDGIVLDEYKTVLPYTKDLKSQESYIKNSSKVIINIAILSVLVLIIFFFFIRKLNLKSRLPVAIILFGIVASFGIFKIDAVYAGINEEQQTYLDSLNDQSNPVWTIVQSSGKVSELFNITSISSPLPPAVKIYEPGESFSLNYNVTYGECNNEPLRYVAYAYRSSDVWGKVPKLDGTNLERLAYWQNNGSTMVNYTPPTLYGWKTPYMSADLKAVTGVSVEKEQALKRIVGRFTSNSVGGCRLGGNICFIIVSQSTSQTSSATINWFVSNAQQSAAFYTALRDDLKNAPGNPLSDRPGLRNFNFLDTGRLSTVTGHDYTSQYIGMIFLLSDEIEQYTSSNVQSFVSWYSFSEHASNLVPFSPTRAYTAPTKPGFHFLYFYLNQDGNSGMRDKTVRVTICVRGASLCPNEKVNPVVRITGFDTITQRSAYINWIFTDENGDKQADYSIQVSPEQSFVDQTKILRFPGDQNSSTINTTRKRQLTGLQPGTTYYVKMMVKSNNEPYNSLWVMSQFKTSDIIGQCNTTTKHSCVSGTPTILDDGVNNYRWTCTGTNGNNAGCLLPKPVTAVCGTASSTCSKGTLGELTDSTTDYLWQCLGIAGGGSTMCSIPKPISPTCGTSKNTCLRGTFTDKTDTTTDYLWQCNGSTETTPVACSARISAPVVNGQCSTTVNNICISGTLRSTSAGTGDDTVTHYKFNCDGSGGGVNATCSVPKPVAGRCSTTVNTCDAGSFKSSTPTSTTNWQCLGLFGGATASCSSSVISTSTPPACGSVVSTCSSGNLFEIADNDTNYLWRCDGVNGANTSCVIPKTGPGVNEGNPVCGNANKVCLSGILKELNDSQTEYIWQCNGINTGTSRMCSAGIGTEVVNGSCGSEKDVCNSGWLDLDGAQPICKGYNGGSNDTCNFTESTEPKITLNKYPFISIKKGGTCQIVWETENIPNNSNCTLKGLGVSVNLENNSSGTVDTPALQNNQRYTLECNEGGLTAAIKSSVLCRVDSTTLEN